MVLGQFSDICGPAKDHKGYDSAVPVTTKVVSILIILLISSNSSYVICVCLRILVSNTYCVVFFILFVLRLVSCVPNVASFSKLSILDCSLGLI
jgi:hypothetical protein